MPRRTALKTLADVEFTFGLPDRLTNYISNSVPGTHSKVIAGFDSTPWRDAGSNGDALSDGPMQACWDSNPKKEGQGSLSFLIGGLVTSYMNQQGLGVAYESPQLGLLQSELVNYSKRARNLLGLADSASDEEPLLAVQARVAPGVRRKTTEIQLRTFDVGDGDAANDDRSHSAREEH